ncbi:tRNA pseudouridine(55) synthase TruB [Sansalvadorimonas verongulae]|uniref:tRNA pseudouridine(55) synthase TruB n=1 Tax=Sansalvadorimonas verongulae TaxID=2172824 RepID=UPI0012BBF41F|nr:tRNA pseudouridine(55) synthase TruB [Sansalvadorimonas verongulae]MTI15087.1 tRNA pseudouridine(55) synthase TruB [Sansalvadorimonas verongulae]
MSGRRRFRGRPVNGIVVVDKPIGESSNAVLQQVKRLYGAAKAGHTGSLDPLATGVLPVCLGEATKLSQYLLDSDKSYRTTAKLGIRTNTGDAEGEVVSERPVAVTESDLEPVLARFRGPIEQVPSMFSALKHNGKPLYEYARQGIEIERPARKVNIYRLSLIEFRGDELVLEVDCSKGTYIRSLVEDIGEMLGCGAHVAELRRLKAGPYEEVQSFTVEALEEVRNGGGHAALDNLLLAQDSAVSHWPAVMLGESSSYYLTQGQPVQVSRAPTSGFVRIYRQIEDAPNTFLGIGEIQDDGLVAPRRLVATKG